MAMSIVRLLRDFLLFFVFARHFLPKARRGGRRAYARRALGAVVALALMVAYVALFGRDSLFNTGDLRSLVKALIFSLGYFLLFRFVFDMSPKASTLGALMFFGITRAGQGFYHATFECFLSPDSVFRSDVAETLIVCLINAVLALVLAPDEDEMDEDSITPAHIALLAFALIFYLVVHTSESDDASSWDAAVLIVQSVCLLVLCVLTNRLVAFNCRQRRGQRLNVMIEAEYAQMLQRQRTDQQIRAVYHDVRQALNTLVAEGGDAQSLDAVSSLKDSLSGLRATPYTKTPMLNILLNEKVDDAARRGVRLDVSANVGDCSYIDSYDMVTIFGNLLTNAIEAVEKLEEGERQVSFEAVEYRSLQVFRIVNPYEGSAQPEGGLSTSKRDEAFHGFGMDNVRRCVAGYRGTVKVSAEGGLFEVVVSLPLEGNRPREAASPVDAAR